MTAPRTLYCHCAYAKVVPEDVKRDVLTGLADARVPFEAVADLCEMSARRDPSLKRIAEGGPARIAACYPRAVKWLFHAADVRLPDDVEVLNMREETAEQVIDGLLREVEV